MRFKVGDKVIVKSIQGNKDAWAGEVVTITDISDGISKGNWVKKDNEGGYRYIEDERLLPLPKPGDKVKFRTWEDMEKQYGITDSGCIETPRSFIFRTMKICCGTITTVTNVYPDHTFFEGNDTEYRHLKRLRNLRRYTARKSR